MMMSLYVTLGIFLLLAAPVRQSEPDRVHGVVELRSCRSHGSARITTLDRSQRIDRVGRAYHHWHSPDSAVSAQAI